MILPHQIKSKEDVETLFDYKDGALYWKIKPYMGKKAGVAEPRGYVRVGYKGKKYLLHRLIFLYHHGYLPEIVDHINNDQSNNNIENLRASDSIKNQYNRSINKNNLTGIKGVKARHNKYVVSLRINGEQKHFGTYEDLELAALVANEARNKYHGIYARYI